MAKKLLEISLKKDDYGYFERYLVIELKKEPVSVSGHNAVFNPLSKSYNYQLTGNVNLEALVYPFEITFKITEAGISPVEISVKGALEGGSEALAVLSSRVLMAFEKVKSKPTISSMMEARLSSGFSPMRSTISFGKYTIIPADKRADGTPIKLPLNRIDISQGGFEFKLRYNVEGVDNFDVNSIATIEAKEIAAWLTLIFGTPITFKLFTSSKSDPEPEVHYEKISRPFLKPHFRAVTEEIKIPEDFLELWDELSRLSREMRHNFMASCFCYQAALDLERKYPGLSYGLYVSAIDILASRVVKEGARKRFVNFILTNTGITDSKFRKMLKELYGKRSAYIHSKGIGPATIFPFDYLQMRELTEISNDLLKLNVLVNASLIGFLKGT